MRHLTIAVLCVVLACAVAHATPTSKLVVEYVDVGVTATVTIPCDWAHVILLRNVPPAVVWGHGTEPKSPGEALWRMDGLRNDDWTNATFLRGDEQ